MFPALCRPLLYLPALCSQTLHLGLFRLNFHWSFSDSFVPLFFPEHASAPPQNKTGRKTFRSIHSPEHDPPCCRSRRLPHSFLYGKEVPPYWQAFPIPGVLPAPEAPAFLPGKAVPPVLTSLPFAYPECHAQRIIPESQSLPGHCAQVSTSSHNPAHRHLHLHPPHPPTLQSPVLLHRKVRSMLPGAESARHCLTPDSGFPACASHLPLCMPRIPGFPHTEPLLSRHSTGPHAHFALAGPLPGQQTAYPLLFHTAVPAPESFLIPRSSAPPLCEIPLHHKKRDCLTPAHGMSAVGPDFH